MVHYLLLLILLLLLYCLTKHTSQMNNEKPTLTKLLCDGNQQLSSAPENMRGDSNLLIHCLEMQQKFKDVIIPKEDKHSELRAKSDELQHELSQARCYIDQLERDIAHLEWERPDQYIYWKGRFLDLCAYVLRKMIQAWEWVKLQFLKWREKRRTHPLY